MRLDKSGRVTARLSDLAQVIPKGRALHVLVGEQDVSCHPETHRLFQTGLY